MFDIHTHILPGVDDGPMFLEEALEMARISYDSGVDGIVLTPHCNIPGRYENLDLIKLKQDMKALKEQIEDIGLGLQVYDGAEIFMTREAPSMIKNKELLSINSSNYYLVEFFFDAEYDYMSNLLKETMEKDVIPIVAHPERYDLIKETPELVKNWLDMGCLLQVNKGSIMGRFGRRVSNAAWELIDMGVVSVVASDAHQASVRTPDMEDLMYVLKDELGNGMTMKLLQDNPLNIINNKDIR